MRVLPLRSAILVAFEAVGIVAAVVAAAYLRLGDMTWEDIQLVVIAGHQRAIFVDQPELQPGAHALIQGWRVEHCGADTWETELGDAVDMIAGLTAVDGATVITDQYELIAFGAKIARRVVI